MSHALFSSSFEIAAAEAATLAPSNRTRKKYKHKIGQIKRIPAKILTYTMFQYEKS
jgi:hypothetical protein